jgi:hypothetical protein
MIHMIPKILGYFFIMKATNLIFVRYMKTKSKLFYNNWFNFQTTLFIHNKTIVYLGDFTIIVWLWLYLDFFVSYGISNFYLIFPFILNCITLCLLLYLPKKLNIWEPLKEVEENLQLLKFKKSKNRIQSKRDKQEE